MDNTYLKEMEDVNLHLVQKESLVDIKDVKVDTSLSRTERLREFVKQVGNPYCFLCEGVIVKMCFADTEETLEDKLNAYFMSL